jgi:hypothetical protein
MSDFKMILKGDDGRSPPAGISMVRPDEKGPKTVAIFLLFGGLLLALFSYEDLVSAQVEDFSEEDVLAIIETPNSQGDNISVTEFQLFHDESRDSGAYTLRGYSLAIGSLLIISGAIALFKLHSWGAKFAIVGAVISGLGGFQGTLMIKDASDIHLGGTMSTAYEITSYLCGICLTLCGLIALLPLLNASAKAALDRSPILIHEEE